MGSLSHSGTAARSSARNHRSLQYATILVSLVTLCWIQISLLPSYLNRRSATQVKISQLYVARLNAGLEKCALFHTSPVEYALPVSATRSNPRWNPVSGQNGTILLRNVTLFDGDTVSNEPMDVKFSNGVIVSVAASGSSLSNTERVHVFDMGGKFVTPGLVDMHSHHTVDAWPMLEASSDGNEISKSTSGPLTPFVRSLDGMKPYDEATRIIASGGITTSLILPGSANIMGGEAYPIKNFVAGGKNGELVIDEMLLEHGTPQNLRRRYMKMACGENPRGLYGHTRMGDAWILRKHLSRAKELLEKQDEWCLSAAAAKETGDMTAIRALTTTMAESPGLPEELELDSTVAMLRGQVNINIHCYEPEDFEDMLRHSREFGFTVRAFHHALSAWQVPEMIKDLTENVTIATFAEMGLYKKEAYEANLWAGSILAKHHIPVAYKSDHVIQETSSKFLMYQAAVGHSFHLPEDLALQSVTSVPARSLQVDHRVGFIKAGYDADIVVWNSHPLRIGATPLQVFIDGKATLDPEHVVNTLPRVVQSSEVSFQQPRQRAVPDHSSNFCLRINQEHKQVVVTGIRKSFLDTPMFSPRASDNMTLVLLDGKIACFGSYDECVTGLADAEIIHLENGSLTPGLTVLSNSLGLQEIAQEEVTGDGMVSSKVDVLDPKNVPYAKYGIHLEGKAFQRARFGGVTKAIQHPLSGGFMAGVSVAIKTRGNETLLDGGIFASDVALHFVIGQGAKGSESITRVSASIEQLRRILTENLGKDSVYGKAANGSIPVAVHVNNKYDILQLIKLKQENHMLDLIVVGGAGAPSVAKELAAAHIPVILASFRCAPDAWEKRDCLAGPPLTKSSVQVLHESGVFFGIAIEAMNDAYIHDLITEASWAMKYTDTLTEADAVNLVSRNIEKIFGLDVDEATRDFVVWEGNPLEFGAAVVLSVDGQHKYVMDCWPEVQ